VVTLRALKIGWLITLSVRRTGVESDNSVWPANYGGIETNCIDRTAIIDKAFELDNPGHQVQIDGHAVRTDDWLNLERHARVPRLERCWKLSV